MKNHAEAKRKKVSKPYAEYPLYAHASGQWAKKIKGKVHYFGLHQDWKGALKRYEHVADDLHAGRPPRAFEGELLLGHVVNGFLDAKKKLLVSGEITQGSYLNLRAAGVRLADHFGGRCPVENLTPEKWQGYRKKLTDTLCLLSVKIEIKRVKSIMKWAHDNKLMDTPMVYGSALNPPKAESVKKEKNSKEKRFFQPHEVRQLIDAADVGMKPKLLLGINCGIGNNDICMMPIGALDMHGGWMDYPRPKTGQARKAKLWPETIDAVKAWLEVRPKAKSRGDADLLFLRPDGRSYKSSLRVEGVDSKKAVLSADACISVAVGKLCETLGIRAKGRSMYSLRHSYRDAADECMDQPAIACTMGHSVRDMSVHYRKHVSDARLERVAACVREWLWPSTPVAEIVNVKVS